MRQLHNRVAPVLRLIARVYAAAVGFKAETVKTLALHNNIVIHKAGFKIERSSRALKLSHHCFRKVAALVAGFLIARQHNLKRVLVKAFRQKRLQTKNAQRNAALHIQRARPVSTAVLNGKGAGFGFLRVAENRIQMPR